jgi:3-phenylpropionate/trans-cinnamate dioxygenase ferredoxin reductase component
MSAHAAVVIVGSGQAGGRAAEALRQGGHTGRITLIGDEAHAPYERPCLSKEFLATAAAEKLSWVRPSTWYADAGITVLSGTRAVGIDTGRSVVELDRGSPVEYETLILTTGARPRPLPVQGANHPRVSYLRTIDDSRRLQQHLLPGARVVVIGAGFSGMEVTATAVAHGCTVTVLELTDLPMSRVIPAQLGAFYAAFHSGQGVDLRMSTGVGGIEDYRGRPVVHTDSGQTILADVVVVGIGVIPNVELAQSAGLQIDNGIAVDEYGRTGDSRIYAAGDVTSHYNPLLGCRVRLESWQNAQNQAIAVARNVLGADRPYAEVPWLWSDQYGLNLQIAGLPRPGDEVVRRIVPNGEPGLFFHLRDGRLAAVIGVDSARDVRFGKEIIAMKGAPTAADLADASVPLASVYAAVKRAAQAA